MLILALDTATPTITAGIIELSADGKLNQLALRQTTNARAHAERLIPQVLECCEEIGKSLMDMDAVVVGCGPGPFTGLRVGMASAVGIGDAARIPVYGVGTLDAIAYAALAQAGINQAGINSEHNSQGSTQQGNSPTSLLVVTDARRREVYYAGYSSSALGYDSELSSDSALPPEIASVTQGSQKQGSQKQDSQEHAFNMQGINIYRTDGPAVGSATDIALEGYSAVAGDPEKGAQLGLPIIPLTSPTPEGLVAMAVRDILEHRQPAPLTPFYLRRPDAVVPKKRPVSSSLIGLDKLDTVQRDYSGED